MENLDTLLDRCSIAELSELELFDAAELGIMLLDADLNICFWNAWLSDWTGVEPATANDKSLGNLFPQALGSAFSSAVDLAIHEQRPTRWTQREAPEYLDAIEWAFTDGGRAQPLKQLVLSPLSVGGDCRCLMLVSDVDCAIPEQQPAVKSNLELPPRSLLAGAALPAVLEHIADAVVLVSHEGIAEYLNPRAEQLLGISTAEADGQPVDVLIAIQDSAGTPEELPCRAVLSGEVVERTGRHVLVAKDDSDALSVEVTAIALNDDRSFAGCGLIIKAFSDANQLSSRLHWHSTHDPLTLLANRRQLESELVAAIESAQNHHTAHTLLYIDIYNFSVVNDTSGYKAGDELLRQFARMLERLVSPKDVVSRIGSDEFAVLVNERSAEEAREFAEALLWEARLFSFPWEEQRLKAGVSIGAKVIDSKVGSVSEIDILLAAGASCRLAKEAGRNRIHFHFHSTEVMQRQSILEWVPKISDALEEDRYELCFQPIVPADDISSIQHYELLLRMIDREGNSIAPHRFIPAAERYSLIEDIDRWVFDHLVNSLSESERFGGANAARFAINLSGFTVGDDGWVDYVLARTRESGIDPQRIQFEITETTAIRQFDRTVRLIQIMKDAGFRFALDDFGNGLSSLGYLKHLPVDYLKIDGGFIKSMSTDDVDYSMVSTINHLGHLMGIRTIAECVETEQQLAMLKDIGVDFVQGFYISRPRSLKSLLGLDSPVE
jgi:diguanylate cyclase (GGDEF)-like protein/PAS domain S-box-containing protein